MAKDLAGHGYFIEDFYTHNYDQDKKNDLLLRRRPNQQQSEEQKEEEDYKEGEEQKDSPAAEARDEEEKQSEQPEEVKEADLEMVDESTSQQEQPSLAANSTNVVAVPPKKQKKSTSQPTFFNRQQLCLFTKTARMTESERNTKKMIENLSYLDVKTRNLAIHMLLFNHEWRMMAEEPVYERVPIPYPEPMIVDYTENERAPVNSDSVITPSHDNDGIITARDAENHAYLAKQQAVEQEKLRVETAEELNKMIGVADDDAIAEQKDVVSNVAQAVDLLDREHDRAEAKATELAVQEVEQYKEQEGL